jgi:hypothetical protein
VGQLGRWTVRWGNRGRGDDGDVLFREKGKWFDPTVTRL